ncbi:relaxase/mobilization nuclease domain-containing protein [Rathayibacter festucae]|uniref:relaxase/mobilization nuclease domain-containing protein n=1 Tax=Rathayibacter festucae TaxID=110937 RepID=UPI001FB4D7F2|nr:relaxase/mobilization nuclease domain-containing protein [Rathayibacter festucae]MCJ1702112.1 relaxase/mobilization nuclease domain-containing protein [Rathayibacter festucae]
MIPNVTYGSQMGGLMSYLAGPGRSNEHTEQHLIAGDSAIMALYGYEVLDRAAALAIARDLDEPAELYGTKVMRSVKQFDRETGEPIVDSATGKQAVVKQDAHVWHCSLSLSAEEGSLTDEKWGAIATDFVQRMGFAGDDIGKANARWVAVRHGASKNGNDHIHIAVSLVREDGTKAHIPYDKRLSQKVCRELERDHGLTQLHPEGRELGERGVVPGAREAARSRSAVEPDVRRLERSVRAAASSSVDEGEFVRRMRQEGLLVRPRFAVGRSDVVQGYSVALRPEKDAPVRWHGGGTLARDLTLPRLREGWPDDPTKATEAAEEWRATSKNPWRYQPVNPGREVAEPSPQLFEKYAADMDRLHDYIRSVDPSDKATWAHVARETAGAYAAWSRRMEPTPGPLADAARSLARSAHLRAHETTPRPAGMPSSSASTALILAAAGKNKNAAAELLLFRQLAKTSHAIMGAHKAAGDARRSAELSSTLQRQLTQVRDGYSTRIASMKAAEREQQWQALPDELKENRRLTRASFGSGSPVPTALTKREQEAADQLARRARESRTQPDTDRGDRGR